MITRDHRELSKQNWELGDDHLGQNIKDLELGCLLRIADATEVMAKNYNKLLDDTAHYKGRLESEQEITKRLMRRIAGLKGHINRLKKSA